MTRPLRLVVVWMAGALALAVAWRLHAWRQWEAAEPAVIAPPPPPLAVPVDDVPRVIAKYLRTRYHGGHSAPVIEVRDEVLRRLLPDTRFFATHLGLTEIGVTPTGTLISFRRAEGLEDDIRTWPFDATDGSAQFLAQFLGVRATTLDERRALALALAQAMAATTEQGWARTSPRCFKDSHAELWRGREHWCDVLVFSSSAGVSRIAISNQNGRRLDVKVSSY